LARTALILTLVKQAGIPEPPGISQEMLAKRESERNFLSQLLDNRKVQSYVVPVPIKAELRSYQQDGINWMAFLAKYQLHGCLCDGKLRDRTWLASSDFASHRHGFGQKSSIHLHRCEQA
jgi:SNF2 family DNA or RNA helicase